MSFDKFKKLLPKPVAQPEGTDDYFNVLANLQEIKPKSKVLPIVSGIAAAIAIVTVVSLWAVIGAGVRNGGVTVPADKYENVELRRQELTPALDFEIWNFMHENRLDCLPVFDSENPPALEHLIYVCEQVHNDLFEDLVLTKEEFESFTYNLLGYKVKLKKNIKYDERPIVYEYDREGAITISYSTSDMLEDGLRIVEVGFQYQKRLQKIRWIVNSQNEFEYVISNIFEDKNYPTPKRDKSITNEMRATYFDFIIDHRVDAMPEFSEGEPPDSKAMKLYALHFVGPNYNEPDDMPIEIEEVKKAAKDRFGIENITSEDMDYAVSITDLIEFPYSELIQYSKDQTENGTIITATVGIKRYYDTYTIKWQDTYEYSRKQIVNGNEWMPYFHRICVFKYIAKDDGVTPERFVEVQHFNNSQDEFWEYFE